MPLKGEWTVYWGPDEDGVPQHEVRLGTWDAISLPGPVMRGFRNASDEQGFLLIATGKATTPVIHHELILKQVKSLFRADCHRS